MTTLADHSATLPPALHRSTDSEAGGIAIFLVSLIAFSLIASAVYIASIGYGTVVLGELQNAADAAALAAATDLTSTPDEWTDSRKRAIDALNKQYVKGNLEEDKTITLDDTDEDSSWSNGTLSVSIERGRFIDGKGFESLEGWESNTPARPGYLAFNALRVRISRNSIDSILSPIVQAVMNLSAEAIGVVGHIRPKCTPPMAVSICSLIAPDGESEPGDTGPGDMIFTSTSRYCPDSDPDCGVHPAFLYSSGGMIFPNSTYTYGSDEYYMSFGVSCGWSAPINRNVQDNFGVFGIPYGRTDPFPPSTNEDSVVNAFQLFNPTLVNGCANGHTVTIGDRFKILEEGLTQESSGQTIWDKIRELHLNDSPDYYHYPELGKNIHYNSFIPIVGSEYISTEFSDKYDPGVNSCILPPRNYSIYPWSPTSGICRSKRVQAVPDTCGYNLVLHPSWTDHDRCYSDPESGQGLCFVSTSDSDNPVLQGTKPFERPRAWRIDVPVIADVSDNAIPCEGTHDTAPSGYEDFLHANPDAVFEIVGYVEAKLYDVDIGGGYPVAADWMAGCPTESYVNTSLPIDPGKNSFGFHDQTNVAGDTGQCNLVRAWIDYNEDRPVLATTDSAKRVFKRRLAR